MPRQSHTRARAFDTASVSPHHTGKYDRSFCWLCSSHASAAHYVRNNSSAPRHAQTLDRPASEPAPNLLSAPDSIRFLLQRCARRAKTIQLYTSATEGGRLIVVSSPAITRERLRAWLAFIEASIVLAEGKVNVALADVAEQVVVAFHCVGVLPKRPSSPILDHPALVRGADPGVSPGG